MSDFTITSNINEAQAYLRKAFDRYPKAVQTGIERAVKDIRADLERSTATWQHDVKFDVTTQIQGRNIQTTVGTDDEIFGYVDQGTRPHAIAPKRPGYPLRFQAKYQAKTTPGQIWSKPGGALGPFVRAMSVWHPGTKARKILETVLRKHDTSILRYIEAELIKVLAGRWR